MSNTMVTRGRIGFGIVMCAIACLLAASSPPAHGSLVKCADIVGGGICQYPQQIYTCSDCVNERECVTEDEFGLFQCQSYTGGSMVFTCTLNSSSVCSGERQWFVTNCVLYTGFWDPWCNTEFNSYDLTVEDGSCV